MAFTGTRIIRSLLVWVLALGMAAVQAQGGWKPAASLASARAFHTATLLGDGRVLVVGGWADSDELNETAELYDPASGSWSRVAPPALARGLHTATLLLDGRVLVVGGFVSAALQGVVTAAVVTTTAEVYDPASGTWSPAGELAFFRSYHTATLLADGRVLVAGGLLLDKAEIYDPASNTWTAAASLVHRRYQHTATLVPDGTVLVAGGGDGSEVEAGLQSAERYDPTLDRWTLMPASRGAALSQSATLLPVARCFSPAATPAAP
jgi:N-acetylneuraminic acid mutarotase